MKAKFIELLQLGYPIQKACQRLKIPKRIYYAWKKRFPDFHEEVVEITQDPVYRARRRIEAARACAERSSDWKIRYAAALEKTESRSEACLVSGAMAFEIENALDDTHADFDPKFRQMVNDVELRRIWEIEDELMRRAKTDNTAAKSVLAARMKDLYEPRRDQTVLVGSFWFNPDGESQAAEAIQKAFGSQSEKEVKEITGVVQ